MFGFFKKHPIEQQQAEEPKICRGGIPYRCHVSTPDYEEAKRLVLRTFLKGPECIVDTQYPTYIENVNGVTTVSSVVTVLLTGQDVLTLAEAELQALVSKVTEQLSDPRFITSPEAAELIASSRAYGWKPRPSLSKDLKSALEDAAQVLDSQKR